jgi:ubiquitin C-terminal hydrolase
LPTDIDGSGRLDLCGVCKLLPFTGTQNVGQSCYTNAALAIFQCFQGRIREELEQHRQLSSFFTAWHSGSILSRIQVENSRKKFALFKDFDPNVQCDASELLCKLVERGVSRHLKTLCSYDVIAKTKCETCGSGHEKNDEWTQFATFASAGIPEFSAKSAMEYLLKPALIDGYDCRTNNPGGCQNKESIAKQSVKFTMNPFIIVQTVSRRGDGDKGRKLYSRMTGIEDEIRLKAGGIDAKYRALGITVHVGNLGGGHYYACCRSKETGIWYRVNDASVSAMQRGLTAQDEKNCTMVVWEKVNE